MKKHFLIIFLSLCFVQCTQLSKEQKDIITDIISDPINIHEICINSSFRLSEILINNIEKYSQLYIEHFTQFKKEYKIKEVIESDDEKNKLKLVSIKLVSIYITDQGEKVSAEFQFRKQEKNWIFHNIIIPGF